MNYRIFSLIIFSMLLLLAVSCKEKPANNQQTNIETSETAENSDADADDDTDTEAEEEKNMPKTVEEEGDWVTSSAVSFRSGPGTNYKRVSCSIATGEEGSIDEYSEKEGWQCESYSCWKYKNAKFASKGKSINTSERTAEKMPVKKWQAYWYKIGFTSPGNDIHCEDDAWVYGEFLKKAPNN